MFSNSPYVIVLPKWSRPLLPFWQRYNAGWEGIFTFAKVLIDRKLAEIERRVEQQEALEGEYLTYLLSNTDMSLKDVYGSVAELLLAGVDTTSNTLAWALHLLSLNPHIQNRLYSEVSQSCPEPSAEEVTRMPYLKATIKETLRMYPVVPLNARIFSEKDVVIGGYYFPKKGKTLVEALQQYVSDAYDDIDIIQNFSNSCDQWIQARKTEVQDLTKAESDKELGAVLKGHQ
ncbi:hypothetical protein WMY93_031405 [Mugilogobius chulae]|uniref:Uncharacterized protein n=1 Tax=Mugilogobius chulae TaxID=88201 RepID=A0AAW0MME6_9GOBI